MMGFMFAGLPFGFGLSIGEIQNSFNISANGTDVAGLTTPLGASTSDIRVLGPMDTEGTINISIVNTPLEVPDAGRGAFSQFSECWVRFFFSTWFCVPGGNVKER